MNSEKSSKNVMDEKKDVEICIKKLVQYMSDEMKTEVGDSCSHAIERGEKGYCYPCLRERFG